MGTEITADELEEIVMTWVSQQKADVLEEVYKVIPLTCGDDIKGKRLHLLNTLLAHLVGLAATDVEAINKKIHTLMQSQGGDIKPAMPQLEDVGEVKTAGDVSSMGAKNVKTSLSSNANSVVDLVRFKEFKISGTIFGKGESRISYASLKHLVENAQSMHYSETMISMAIIKAISPSHKVKALLEGKHGVTVAEVMELLRAHYKKEDLSSVLTELRTAVQQSADSALDFVTELMCLKSRVIELSREERYPLDLMMLTKDLFKSMYTGLRNPNIRAELREMCAQHPNQSDIDDNLLTKYVSDAMANEEERQKKLISAKIASASVVETEAVRSSENKQHRQRDNPFDKIEELRISQEKEMSMLRADFAEVKTALLAKNHGPNHNSQQNLQTQFNNNCGGGFRPLSYQNGGNQGGGGQSSNSNAHSAASNQGSQQGNQGMYSNSSNSNSNFAPSTGQGFVGQGDTGQFVTGWYAQNQPQFNTHFGGYGYGGVPQGSFSPLMYGPNPPAPWPGYQVNSGFGPNPQNPQNDGNSNGGSRGGNARGRGGFGGSRRNRNKCDGCVQGNIRFCVHCLKCGADDHRANACPRSNDPANNGGGNGQVGGNLNGGGGSTENS